MDYKALAQELMKYLLEMPGPPRDAPSLERDRGEMLVIVYLQQIKNGASPGDLAKFGKVSTARIATVLNSLEKKGFITRSVDPSDRRKVVVHITEEGSSYGDERRNKRMNHLADMLEYLGDEDALRHVQIMKQLNEYYKQKGEEQCSEN